MQYSIRVNADPKEADGGGRGSQRVSWREWEEALHSLFMSISYEAKSPFKLWRPDRYISKDAFLEMFPCLPGVIGDRLFSAFDIDNSGTIDYHEFLEGMRAMGHSAESKLAFLHRMYDLNGDGVVSKDEIMMILSHAPTSDEKRIEQIINQAFDANRQRPRLDFPAFVKTVERDDELKHTIETFWNEAVTQKLPAPLSAGSSVMKDSSTTQTPIDSRTVSETAAESGHRVTFASPELKAKPCFSSSAAYCGWVERSYYERYFAVLKDKYMLLYKSPNDAVPSKAICLVGSHVGTSEKASMVDRPPNELVGVYVTAELLKPPSMLKRFRHSFSISHVRGHQIKLYCRHRYERDEWVEVISRAIDDRVYHFHAQFLLKEQLGAGRFSTVFHAVNRTTGEQVAVKIMKRFTGSVSCDLLASRHRGLGRRSRDRADDRIITVNDEMCTLNELREFQRTEVSVLKLLHHPNVIRMLDVYQSRDYMYIVMQWSAAGDLRNLLDAVLAVNRAIFTRQRSDYALSARSTPDSTPQNSSCRATMRMLVTDSAVNYMAPFVTSVSEDQRSATDPAIDLDDVTLVYIPEEIIRAIVRGIVEGLSYLHSKLRNVVHRDIKPDNILLDFRLDDFLRDIKRRSKHAPRLEAPAAVSPRVTRLHNSARSSSALSEPSSVDTVDQYEPAVAEHLRHTVPLLGSLPEDERIADAQVDTARSKQNAWFFVHIMIWMYKESADQRFLQDVSELKFFTSQWLPNELYDEFSYEELVALIVDNMHPKITDFGLSKILAPDEMNDSGRAQSSSAASRRTKSRCERYRPKSEYKLRASTHLMAYTCEPMGTEAYAAPEVKQGLGYTTSADLWSLGVLCYQLLSNGYFPSYDGTPQCPGQEGFGCTPRSPLASEHSVLCYVPAGIWEPISKEAKDFVQQLLVRSNRPSAEACLQMDWFAKR